MRWFKHYGNAHQSNDLTIIEAEFGMAGYGRYWLLLELMCGKFDGENDTRFIFNYRQIKKRLGLYHDNRARIFFECLNNLPLMSCVIKNNLLIIESDILSRLQGRDYKKARSKTQQTAPKNKEKDKEKDKEKNNKKSACVDSQKLIEVYNNYAPPHKKHNSFFLAPRALEKLEISSGFPGLDNLEGWEKIFALAFKSEFLKTREWCNLIWLLDADNAQKVLENSYGSTLDKIETDYTEEDLAWN